MRVVHWAGRICGIALLAVGLQGCCGGGASSDESAPAKTTTATTSKPKAKSTGGSKIKAKGKSTAKGASKAKPVGKKLDPSKVKPGQVLKPVDLQTSFFADKAAWKGKKVTVKGQVNSTQEASKKSKPKYFVSLRSKGLSGYQVYCEFDLSGGKTVPKVKNGGTVTG